MGGIQSNSLMNFSSFERLRDDLLFNLVACFSPLLPPPTSISNKHKKIPLQNKLLEVFQLYDESKVGAIPMTFLPLVIQELDPNLLQLKKEEGIVTAAASTSVNASASATATTQLEWIGRFCTVDNNKEDEEETSFDYLFFLEFVFYPMCTNLYQVEIKKTLGPMDIYTNVFEAQLVYHQQSPKNQKTTRHVLVKQLTLDHTNMNHTKSNSYSSNIHTILHLIRHRINILRLFQHPHLLKFYSTLQQQNYKDLYLIQEYQEHCTLKTTLKAFGPMKETTIRRYLLQILDALEFLHTKGLFHGNLHAESIYIDSYGQVKLGEFYVGHLLREICLTKQEFIEYQPPEKISSTKRTTKTDVWHVGLLALQMYTGEGGEGKISRSSIPNIPSSISKSLRLFIRTCLQVDPLKRPNVSSLRLMDFFQVDPTKETNDMLKNVCDELDVSMRRLEREIVSPLRTNKLTTIASRLSYPHSTSNFRKKKKQATCDRLLLK